jgi:hypothetical protein
MPVPAPKQLVTALIFSAAFCMSANAADQPPVTLTISGPQTVTVGDTVIIHPVLKNVSNRPIGISLGRPYTVLVHDESGKELSRKPGVLAGSSVSTNLMAGELASDFNTNLSSWYDLSLPGKYSVRFSRYLVNDDLRTLLIESNEITITIIAPPKKNGQ